MLKDWLETEIEPGRELVVLFAPTLKFTVPEVVPELVVVIQFS